VREQVIAQHSGVLLRGWWRGIRSQLVLPIVDNVGIGSQFALPLCERSMPHRAAYTNCVDGSGRLCWEPSKRPLNGAL
jgi:hypothetical protein